MVEGTRSLLKDAILSNRGWGLQVLYQLKGLKIHSGPLVTHMGYRGNTREK